MVTILGAGAEAIGSIRLTASRVAITTGAVSPPGQRTIQSLQRLVVGGGRTRGFPSGRVTDISLNISLAAHPDVVGDVAKAPFKSKVFEEVFFERVPFQAFTGDDVSALRESARVLAPGGHLVIETGIAAPTQEILTVLRAASFTNIQVTTTGLLRVTATLGGG